VNMKTFAVVVAAFGALCIHGGQPTAAVQDEDVLVVLRLRDGVVMKSLPVVNPVVHPGGFSVTDVVADGHGGWFIYGDTFTSIGGVECPGLVHILRSLAVDPKWCPNVGRSNFLHAGNLVGLVGQTLYAIGERGLAAIDVNTGFVRRWYRGVEGERMAVGAGHIFVGAWPSEVHPTSSIGALDVRTGRRLRWKARFNNANRERYRTRCYVHFGGILVRGQVVYVGGTFSRVDGQRHVGLVALDARTGRPLAWRANVDRDMIGTGLVGLDEERWHLAAAGKRLYVGGEGSIASLGSVNGVRRGGVAALSARTGGVLSWNPRAGARIFDARGSAVVLGGWDCLSFARVDTTRGRKVIWRARPVPADVGSDFVTISGSSVLVHYSDGASWTC
jgi:hypothetical protein